ncbi:hypothetical protein CBM2587_A170048 [Cupriavidus taiwanensis]|uniref:Uncharacterized protein n=1 Tax=Cupriavidus taiwanensis TaxID=164546 RepID=A0A975WYK1_9BURK|nr:hypothetical protein CBM2587_A170048 [Cupriavidus taiwanensis]
MKIDVSIKARLTENHDSGGVQLSVEACQRILVVENMVQNGVGLNYVESSVLYVNIVFIWV